MASGLLPGRLVLLGHPVEHSLSPAMQNAALRLAGIRLEYEALDVPAGKLATIAALLGEADGAGNVTVPYKTEFSAMCATISPVAERVGAVNTFWTENGMLIGDNTDVGGFDAAIRSQFGPVGDRADVAVIGAGGAAGAVLAAVERWDGARARLYSRSHARAAALAARFARTTVVATDLRDALDGASLVVNATPVGLRGDALPVETSDLPAGAHIYDLTYRRGETPWVHACRARGLRAADGLSMLLEQGALSFERWFGLVPDRAAMMAALR